MSEPDTEFKTYPKIPRLRHIEAVVTEKIDGTNAQVFIPDDPAEPLRYGSRNRWVTPESDNYGFAAWATEHADVLRRLGPGRHYGEWWGAGIQRRYGQERKFFSLFNVDRFRDGLPDGLPENVSLVPVLYRGPLDTPRIDACIAGLYEAGSVVVPGWLKPEGVVIRAGELVWKITDNGDAHKGAA